jgi:hypothetical protein
MNTNFICCKPLSKWTGFLSGAVLFFALGDGPMAAGKNNEASSEEREPAALEPPIIPVGLDAYRMWDRWPYQRIGVRAYMRSTYDRTGGNHSADASHYLYQERDDFNVTLDVEGRGVLYFARYNRWHGSPWHYEVDGTNHIVQESTTADPDNPVAGSVFLPEHLFPNPLTWTWSTTKGADLMWVPIPFERSFRMAYSRTRYGTGYYIYHLYPSGARLSRPIRAWDQTPPDPDVLELIGRAGTDIAPQAGSKEGRALGMVQQTGRIDLPKDGVVVLTTIAEGPSMLRALEISVPREHAVEFSRARLRITWDNRAYPSVKAPAALFFGTGTFYNRDDREYLVKGFPINVRYDQERIHLACYFPMPFFESARIELLGNGQDEFRGVNWRARYHPFHDPPNHAGYFHATYRDHPEPELGQDLVLLDTQEVEGGGDWSGSFVGTSFIFSHEGDLATLEGDPRFFFDDSLTPQAQGTGTEEWGGGGDYWGGQTMTLPFAGHPTGAPSPMAAKDPEDLIQSAYRFLLADLMPFGKRAVIRLEHGGVNQSTEHYETVTYWYGLPSPSLIKTGVLKVGDLESERAHQYHSPDASEPYEITSRYEWGAETRRSGWGFEDLRGAEDFPHADPLHYAEFEFEADAGKTYYIWARGKGLVEDLMTDASWFQFNEDIGTATLARSYRHSKAFGNWLDRFPANTYAWSSALPDEPPQTIVFARPGTQRLRVQPRQTRHFIEQIWLSATQETLPAPNLLALKPEQPGDRSQIVLNASDAKSVHGEIRVVEEASAFTGFVLDINGRQDHEPVVFFPPHTDTGRTTRTFSEFRMEIEPDNFGVLLRRKLDYQFPNQRAEVYVADGDIPREELQASDWKSAGIWYLAGSNTFYFSYPREQLGKTNPIVITSNRRFRDDEFMAPRELTSGRSSIRFRVEFTPVERPLLPGMQIPPLAWSEIRYDAFSVVMPKWPPQSK